MQAVSPDHHEPTPQSSADILKHLASLPPQERENYWYERVYRGNVKQLTVRAVLMGMALGAIMSVSNLYVGLKIGWGMGVTITSGILAYAIFRALEKVLPGGEFTDLENNAMQSVASAAGSMSSAGLVSAIPALLLLNGQTIPPVWLALWLCAISVLGCVIAIPLKRQMINVDQLPFPSGIAAAETIKSLHSHGQEATEKAKVLGLNALFSAVLEYFRSGHAFLMGKIGAASLAFSLPEAINEFSLFGRKFTLFPTIGGVPAEKLTMQFDTSLLLLAAGAIVGLRTGVSIMIGAVLNWCVVAPWLVANHIEVNGKVITGGYRAVVGWATWPGAGTMVIGTLVAMAFQWRSIARGFSGLLDVFKRSGPSDPREAEIEVPGSWFGGGMLFGTLATVVLQGVLFGISPALGVLSVMFTVVLSMVATRVAGETDIAPLGAMGKVTQFAYAAITPHQPVINLMSANVTAGAASHTSDLLGDLKSGYILGAKPRQQFLAQLFGIMAGTLVSVPAYYAIVPDASVMSGDNPAFPAPAAQVWKATAQVLSKGIEAIPPTALHFAGIVIVLTIIMTVLEQLFPKVKRYMPSPTGIGLAFIIQFSQSFSIFLGAAAAAIVLYRWPIKAEKFTITASSGLIAGESIMAVVIIGIKKLLGGLN